MTRILLIEDEQSLRKVIKLNLELEGFELGIAEDGAEALDKFNAEHFDLVILDLMLPKLSGLDVLKTLRVKDASTPIIIISAKDTSSDRIQGLKLGADDYLTKPFEIEELLLRINNLIKRADPVAKENILSKFSFGNCTVDFDNFSASKQGVPIELSQKEIHILRFLIINKNKVVSRQEILKAVWGYDVFPSTRTIDNFIASLRKNLEIDPKHPQYIKSVHGVGYKFVYL